MLKEMKYQVSNSSGVWKYFISIVVALLVINIYVTMNSSWEKLGLSRQKLPAYVTMSSSSEKLGLSPQKPPAMVNQTCHDEAKLLLTDPDILVKNSVSLYMRMTGLHIKRFYCDFLRTTVLFWPASFGKLVVVFDEESSQDHEYAKILERQFNQFFPDRKLEILYEPLPRDHETLLKLPWPKRDTGYNRQIWSSFFNDLYTNDTVIAWIDSDSALSSPVTRNNLFNGTRLRVIGTDCSRIRDDFARCIKSTELTLGLPVVSEFMLHFPIYIYRDTYTNCRNHLMQRYKARYFEEVYRNISAYGITCPVTTILNYAWYFERDRYDWSLNICSAPLNEYNKRFKANATMRPFDFKPIMEPPQSSIHTGEAGAAVEASQLIVTSYCVSHKLAGHNLTFCSGKGDLPITNNLIHFKYPCAHNACKGALIPTCTKILQRHYGLVGCELSQNKRRMEWSDVEIVEELVKEIKTTCAVIHHGKPGKFIFC